MERIFKLPLLTQLPPGHKLFIALDVPQCTELPWGRHLSFVTQPTDLLSLFLRFHFMLWFVLQPSLSFSLISCFYSQALRLCYTAFSPIAIADTNLRFATLGGNYLWRDFLPAKTMPCLANP